MRNTVIIKKYGSSDVFKKLLQYTKIKKVEWIPLEAFVDFLEVEGIAFDDIRWFNSYLMHIQRLRHYADFAETYFTFFEDRIFALSRGKYSREIRMDFASSFKERCVWRGVIETQSNLIVLYRLVNITNFEDSKQECENLLLATDCIHV